MGGHGNADGVGTIFQGGSNCGGGVGGGCGGHALSASHPMVGVDGTKGNGVRVVTMSRLREGT
jgi:hypothetical protein